MVSVPALVVLYHDRIIRNGPLQIPVPNCGTKLCVEYVHNGMGVLETIDKLVEDDWMLENPYAFEDDDSGDKSSEESDDDSSGDSDTKNDGDDDDSHGDDDSKNKNDEG